MGLFILESWAVGHHPQKLGPVSRMAADHAGGSCPGDGSQLALQEWAQAAHAQGG